MSKAQKVILKPSKSPLKIGWIPLIFRCFNSLFGSGRAVRATLILASRVLVLNIVRNGGCWNGDVYNRRYISYKTAKFPLNHDDERKSFVRPNMTHQIQVCSGKKKGVHVEVSDVICFEKAVILWRDLRARASHKKRDPWNSCSFFMFCHWKCFTVFRHWLSAPIVTSTFVSTQLGCITDRDP